MCFFCLLPKSNQTDNRKYYFQDVIDDINSLNVSHHLSLHSRYNTAVYADHLPPQVVPVCALANVANTC